MAGARRAPRHPHRPCPVPLSAGKVLVLSTSALHHCCLVLAGSWLCTGCILGKCQVSGPAWSPEGSRAQHIPRGAAEGWQHKHVCPVRC